MSKLYLKNNKATVCADKTCITVYGDTANIVNAIVLTATVLTAIALLAKALR